MHKKLLALGFFLSIAVKITPMQAEKEPTPLLQQTKKTVTIDTGEKLFAELHVLLNAYLYHLYYQKVQGSAFDKAKAALFAGDVVLTVPILAFNEIDPDVYHIIQLLSGIINGGQVCLHAARHESGWDIALLALYSVTCIQKLGKAVEYLQTRQAAQEEKLTTTDIA